MPQVDINIWAVLLATIVTMVLGSIWYSPKVFYGPWSRLVALNPEVQKNSMGKAMGVMFVAAFITNYVLAHVVAYTKADSVLEGLQTGFWMWLGFVGAISIGEFIFAQRSMKLWFITNGYNLINLLLAGMILAVIR